MADNLSKSLRELRKSTEELNALTDKANDLVRRTEKFLTDECRVGGPIHVHVDSMYSAAEGPNGQPGPEYSAYLGFARHKGEQRIVVSFLLDNDPEDVKPWAECPRDTKLKTLEALPDLIEKLLEKVQVQVADVHDTICSLESVIRRDQNHGGADVMEYRKTYPVPVWVRSAICLAPFCIAGLLIYKSFSEGFGYWPIVPTLTLCALVTQLVLTKR